MDKRNRTKARSTPVKKRILKSERPIAIAREGAQQGVDLISAVRELGVFGAPGEQIDPTSLEIGERVRNARIARGWTQSQLARKAKCSQSDISDLERGRMGPQGPSLRTLVAIANALEIDFPIGVHPARLVLAQGDAFGEVRTANTDYCTAYAMHTAEEWDRVRQYVIMHAINVPVVPDTSSYCRLYTLGSKAELRNLRTHVPMVVTLVRGDGRFVTHSPTRKSVHAHEGGVLAILDANSMMEVEAKGDRGLTMMMVPIQHLKKDDELAC